MRPKGLRNVRTIQHLSRRAQSGSREQAVAELARLEHEKARLTREVDVWRQNMRRTETQLEQVEARLVTVRQSIEGEPAPARAPQSARSVEPEPDKYGSIFLEY